MHKPTMNKSAHGIVFTLILLVAGFALILPDKSNVGVMGLESLRGAVCTTDSDPYQICSSINFFEFIIQFIGIVLIIFAVMMMLNPSHL